MIRRKRYQPPAFRAAAIALLLCGTSIFSCTAQTPGESALVYCDRSIPEIAFAAEDVRQALEARSFATTEKNLYQIAAGSASIRIIIAIRGTGAVDRRLGQEGGKPIPEIEAQGYVIQRTKGSRGPACWVVGADAVGAMYGGLRVAESIGIEDSPQAIPDMECKPFIARRGIKFNIPLDARTPSYDDTGDAAQSNIAEMWNFAFWEEFLDDMARHNFNTLTLWNPHPFPSLVKLPDYPDIALDDICVPTIKPEYKQGSWKEPQHVSPKVLKNLKVVKEMTIYEKITFWRNVMKHARDRGIEIYFITWNILTNGAEGQYGITNDQDNPKTIAYLRACTREMIRTYPLLAGIGVTAGENMKNRDDAFAKEKWLWDSYVRCVVDAKSQLPNRTVKFIHRVWQTGVEGVMKDFGSKYPDLFEIGFKYARAHMYSSTKPPFADKLCEEMKPHKVRCWWNIRNDDIFCFRWGDPDYARAFLKNLPPEELTAGYHMGSDGYVWGREFASLDPPTTRVLEIKKHWYKFMLWGRLGYDQSLDRAHFEQVLAAKFPEADGKAMYDAWATASKIIPQVNRFHWNNWDFMWAVEGCMDVRNGFHTVTDFIKSQPMEGTDIISIPDYVKAQREGKSPRGTTPVDVAKNLQGYADKALAQVADIRTSASKPSRELNGTLGDIAAMAHLGEYYSAKILGALELHTFEQSKDAKHKEQAVAHLRESERAWTDYAKVATSQYRPQLLARTRNLDWVKRLEDVKHDIAIAQAAGGGAAEK